MRLELWAAAPLLISAGVRDDRGVQATAVRVATQAAGLVIGLGAAWGLVAVAWVAFATIVPMWLTAAAIVAFGCGLIAWRGAKFAGVAVGLMASALAFGALFTLLSSQPNFD